MHCSTCEQDLPTVSFSARPDRKRGYLSACKSCRNKKSRANTDRLTYHSQYRRDNKDAVNSYEAYRRACQLQATPSWADLESIKRVYKACSLITERTGVPHHVDHVIPLKGKNVCGLHVYSNLAIIPAKMNLSKGNK